MPVGVRGILRRQYGCFDVLPTVPKKGGDGRSSDRGEAAPAGISNNGVWNTTVAPQPRLVWAR